MENIVNRRGDALEFVYLSMRVYGQALPCWFGLLRAGHKAPLGFSVPKFKVEFSDTVDLINGAIQ